MFDYYADKLSAEKLKQVYQCATTKINQYLQAEINFVLEHVSADRAVLELGCGYGRVLASLAKKAGVTVGIDTSLASLQMAARELNNLKNIYLVRGNAASLPFKNQSFDTVVCIQNGLSAFHVDPLLLVSECLRVTRKAGMVFLSSYAAKFWDDRMEWFKIQSKLGLLGKIDPEKTSDGNIVCEDGFTATTYNKEKFERLMSNFKYPFKIIEVDGSSLFCKITVS